VLLAAGVAPATSWRHVAEPARGPAGVVVREVADAVERGRPVAAALLAALPAAAARDRAAWRGLAASWRVAADAGAPLAPTLLDMAGSLRAADQVQRDLRVALASPVATARMVMALPVVGVLFGLALGFDTLGVLFSTLPGIACLVAGAALMLAGHLWNRRLLRAATPRGGVPGIGLDLMAVAVSGGSSIERAREVVRAAVEGAGLGGARGSDAGAGFESGDATVEEVLALSARAGVPAAGLLRSEADEERRRARSEGERRAATLAVTLMLPLGVCVLPAFMLLGVAPLLISVVSSTVGRF